MNRRQRTIRGVEDEAWNMLSEVRRTSRTEKGALVSEAIRFWFDHLEEEIDHSGDDAESDPVNENLHDLAA